MNIIILIAFFSITMTPFLNGVEMTPPPGAPPIVPIQSEKFQTFVECMNYLDKAITDVQNIAVFNLGGKTPSELFSFKLVASYENGYELELTMPNTPLPGSARATMRWECREIK